MLKFIENIVTDVISKVIKSNVDVRKQISCIVEQYDTVNLDKKNSNISKIAESIVQDRIKTEITKFQSSFIAFQINFEDEHAEKTLKILENVEALSSLVSNQIKKTNQILNDIDSINKKLLVKVEPVNDVQVIKDELKKAKLDTATLIKKLKDDDKQIKVELDAFIDIVSEKLAGLQNRKR